MLLPLVFTAALLTQAPAAAAPSESSALAAAEEAYANGDFGAVLPALDQALATDMRMESKRRAFFLRAMTHVAFRNDEAAIAAFQRLLGVDPSHALPKEESPRAIALFEEAKLRGPLGVTPPPGETVAVTEPAPKEALTPPAEEPGEPRSLTPYLLAGGGAAVVAATVFSVFFFSPKLPPGNLGARELR